MPHQIDAVRASVGGEVELVVIILVGIGGIDGLKHNHAVNRVGIACVAELHGAGRVALALQVELDKEGVQRSGNAGAENRSTATELDADAIVGGHVGEVVAVQYTCPAVGIAGRRIAVEVLNQRQRTEFTARSADRHGCGKAGVASIAESVGVEIVVGGRHQTLEKIGGVVHIIAVHTVADNPAALGATGLPSDDDGVVGNIGGCQIEGTGAGVVCQEHIVDCHGGLATATGVVGPCKDNAVGVRGADIECTRDGSPAA